MHSDCFRLDVSFALLPSVSLEAKRAVQIIDGEVQELPSGREMPDVVPTIGLLQIHKRITATWRPKYSQPVIRNVTN